MVTPALSPEQEAMLDRPVWSALTTIHRHLVSGDQSVRRYPADIAPFAAYSSRFEDAGPELRILATDGPVALFTDATVDGVFGLEVGMQLPILQMVSSGSVDADQQADIDLLGREDIVDMLALTSLTRPGPFFPRTYQLGTYIGIRDENRLIAMAGERMRFDGFTEISAVCVHPDYRGRSLGQQLVRSLMASIYARGDIPFLHVFRGNLEAICLYQKLGFAVRRSFQVTQLHHTAPVINAPSGKGESHG